MSFIMYRSLISAKPLHIRFNKVDEFIRDYGGTKYLLLFVPKKYAILDRIKYLIELRSSIAYVDSFNNANNYFSSRRNTD